MAREATPCRLPAPVGTAFHRWDATKPVKEKSTTAANPNARGLRRAFFWRWYRSPLELFRFHLATFAAALLEPGLAPRQLGAIRFARIKLFSGSSYGFTDGALVHFEGEGSLGSWVHTFASPEGREEFLRQLQMEIDEWAAVTVRLCLPGAAGMLAQFLRLNSSPGRLGLSGGAIFSHVA